MIQDQYFEENNGMVAFIGDHMVINIEYLVLHNCQNVAVVQQY